MGTECLITRFQGSLCLPCYVQREAERKSLTNNINKLPYIFFKIYLENIKISTNFCINISNDKEFKKFFLIF